MAGGRTGGIQHGFGRREALVRLDSCLKCLQSIDEAEAETATSLRIKCEHARGDAINTHFGPVEQSAHDAFGEAANLAESNGDVEAAIDALISLSYMKYNAGDFAGAEKVASRLIDYGAQNGNALCAGHRQGSCRHVPVCHGSVPVGPRTAA